MVYTRIFQCFNAFLKMYIYEKEPHWGLYLVEEKDT